MYSCAYWAFTGCQPSDNQSPADRSPQKQPGLPFRGHAYCRKHWSRVALKCSLSVASAEVTSSSSSSSE
jgi:hypothetical protein